MRRLAASGLLAATLCALAGPAGADLVFFKDGYVLQGKVRREGTNEYDPNSKDFTFMPKGLYFVDDGPRKVYFTPTQVAIVERLAPPNEERIFSTGSAVVAGVPMPGIENVNTLKPWDPKKWERPYSFRSPSSTNVVCMQKIGELTPYYVRVDAVTRFVWSSGYLTREFDPDVVLELLRGHPHLQDDYMPPPPKVKVKVKVPAKDKDKPAEKVEEKPAWPDKPSEAMVVARRMRVCDFFAQAGWFDHAERELDRLAKDFPDQKARVREGRILVGKLRSREEWERLKNWYHAGRHEAVRKRVEAFPLENAPDRVLADLREMKAQIARADETLAEAKKALSAVAAEAKTPEGKSLASAVKLVLMKELTPANAERLDAFLGQHREAQRQAARKQKAAYSPDELLALAVSGFLLGSPAAEPRPASAVALYETRLMLLDYCKEESAGDRKRRLARYEKEVKDKDRPDFDEIAQLIDTLPPVDPGEVSETATEVEVGQGRNKTTYQLLLPPEYSHSRSYPVLIVLHGTGEKASDALKKWEKLASDYGYVLAAPQWETGLQRGYKYAESEHDTVTNAIQDLRRRYAVDSDRVFLFGHGEGGKMAFDVGLSRPDLFAGVIPMGAGVAYHPSRYWRNAQYLPFYVINGSRSPGGHTVREQMEHWALRGYPATWVEYKGRGNEWLGGEQANVFDWMRTQRRAFPQRQIGSDGQGTSFGNEFCTHRADDNRFYWLGVKDVNQRCLLTADRWAASPPASITATINTTANEILVKAQGVAGATIWLGRGPKGESMIDFDKAVVVRAGLRPVFNGKLKPSLAVLLEELATRGDRKHLYLARIDVNVR